VCREEKLTSCGDLEQPGTQIVVLGLLSTTASYAIWSTLMSRILRRNNWRRGTFKYHTVFFTAFLFVSSPDFLVLFAPGSKSLCVIGASHRWVIKPTFALVMI
jgi:hypothetical protein